MESLSIGKTNSTPSIQFNADLRVLSLKGESFPENAAKFYSPVLKWIRAFLNAPDESKINIEFEIIYFNSSTSKIFLTLFELLEEGSKKGKEISVIWRCDRENEIALECGEEFKEEIDKLPFMIEVY